MRTLRPAAIALMSLWLLPGRAAAQGVEVTPIAGYGFGGGFAEVLTGRPIDPDGASTFGGSMDVPIGSEGLFLELLYTHQQALFDVFTPAGPPSQLRASVDYFHAGGLQELDIRSAVARPFLTGTLGLTRFAGGGDSEVRFSLAAGGGVKFFANRHVGARLEGRVFATIDDGDASSVICAPGRCLVRLHLSMVWQAALTSGLVVAF
jgi:hypothetical protein